MNEEKNNENGREVHSTVVRAGKRTYFFDIKATRNNDLYLTVTESKKQFQNGRPEFQKHKIFLYKEDFEKFSDTLRDVLQKIDDLKADGSFTIEEESNNKGLSDYTSLNYEDL